MEDVPYENAFSIEAEDSSATTKNRDVRIVSHADVEARDGIVGYERRLVGDHVIHGPGVSYRETTARGQSGWRQQYFGVEAHQPTGEGD
jgi:hypothetical protein